MEDKIFMVASSPFSFVMLRAEVSREAYEVAKDAIQKELNRLAARMEAVEYPKKLRESLIEGRRGAALCGGCPSLASKLSNRADEIQERLAMVESIYRIR